MKLFTVGDSISQGFMSGAAARTDLAYPTLIARCMGLEGGYDYPRWGADGLPINIETILRRLAEVYGDNVNPLEWAFALRTINRVIEDAEDYYERESGRADAPYTDGDGKRVEFFHNVAFQGCDVADSWTLTPEVCREMISEADRGGDDPLPFSGPNAAYYRTALKVLNPSLANAYDGHSQIRWLADHASREGIENLVMWLGANNALGTVITLEIHQTPGDPKRRPYEMSHKERAKNDWNLWRPGDFEVEYRALLEKVDDAMQDNKYEEWKVFVGNVPLVTIAPLAKGVGPATEIERDGKKSVYFKYYSYFPFEENDVREKDIMYLSLTDALYVDDCIRAYNRAIKKLLDEKNREHSDKCPDGRYHLVDTCGVLESLAFKRNAGQVEYEFPDYFEFVYPRVDTKYYHADRRGRLRQGGLFGLDGVHPTAIGQGIVAHEFLKVMKQAGVSAGESLDWPDIFDNDELYSKPITVMHELYNKDWLAKYLLERFTKRRQPL